MNSPKFSENSFFKQLVMKRLFTFSILVLLVAFLNAANGYDVSFNQPSNDIYELNFNLGEYGITEISIDGESYSKIQFDGSVFTQLKGFAELPFISASVRLSDDKNVTLEIIEGEYEEFSLDFPLLPSRGVIYRDVDPSTIPYEISLNSLKDSWYPQKLATNTSPFIIKDLRGTSVYVYPFRYNAVQNVLRVYKNITVQLVENGSNPINPIQKKSPEILREMDGIYNSLFVNYQQSKDDLTIGEYGDILVICTDRDSEAIQPYIDWKMEKGFNVSMEIVPTNTNVKTTVQEAYDANNNLLYVQLVGDWPDLKSDLLSGYAPMDPQLGCVVGSDNVADITIGRISAGSASDVTVQVDKIINYEKNPDMEGTWYKGALGIGSNEGAGNGDDGEVDKNHVQVIWDDKLDPFTFDDYYTAYDPGASTSNVFNAIDNGISLVNYTGHGYNQGWSTSGFSNNNVASLDNGDQLPWLVSVACNNGDFHGSSVCFAEAWMRKEGGGAIMFLGATISQPWQPPMRGQDYFMDILIGGYDYSAHPGQNGISTSEQRTTLGAIVFNGLALMTAESGGNSDWETAKTWHLFGDPSMQPRTDTPAELSISNNVILVGLDFATTVTGPDGAVEGAMVCLSQDDAYYKGVTDAMGMVSIPHALNPGTAQLVITGFNTETVYEEITVVPPGGAYLVVDACTVNDVNANNNGQADYGETVLLDVAIENVGSDNATGIEAMLTTSDPYITINDNSYTYGDVEAGAIVDGSEAFEITISEDIPDNHNAVFEVEFTDDTKTSWVSTMNIMLHAPVLTIQSYYIDDSFGNNNGRLDPGESADIVVPNTNDGSSDALNTFAAAVSTGGLITLNNSTYDLETLLAGETTEAIFNITVSSSAQVGDVADVGYHLEASPYSVNSVLSLKIGLVVEDFESGDFSSYDWEFSGNGDWAIDETTAYEGVYSAQSGNISDNQTSNLVISVDVSSDDQISFFRKVSSEDGYDYLRFYIDNVQKAEWAGEEDWEEFSYPVTAGEHTFKWEFDKDQSVSSGSDCGWIDYIVFPAIAGTATPLSVVASANPSDICAGESSQLNAFATGGSGSYNYTWTPVDGLSDPNIANPVATPESTTTYSVAVDDGENSITDELIVSVNPIPEAPTISIDDNMLVSDATEGNQWYDSNGPIDGVTGQSFQPMVTETYYVIVTSEFGCESEMSNSIYFIYTGIAEEKNIQKISLYPNPNNGIFTVELGNYKGENVSIKVLNALNAVVYEMKDISTSHNLNMDLSHLHKGLYFLVIENYQGSAVQRIIIR